MNEHTPTSFDVIIAGGGMVGLTQALMLVQEMPSLRVALIERHAPSPESAAAGPNFDSRSTAVSAGSVELLDALGVWSRVQSAGNGHATPILSVDVSDKGHLGRTRYHVQDQRASQAFGALGYVVDNANLGAALLDLVKCCPFISYFCPAEVTDITPKSASVDVQVRPTQAVTEGGIEPCQLEAQLLIIADGADSALRSKLGIGAQVSDYQQHAVVANVQHSQPHKFVAFERFTEQGPMALLPKGGERGSKSASQSALVWTRPVANLEQTLAYDDSEFLNELQNVFGYRLGEFKRVSKRNHYPLSLTMAKEQVRSGIVLIGNAAHFLHPVAGQGFNLAVRDCAALTAALASAHRRGQWLGSLVTLQAYMRHQERDQQATTLLSHSFNSLFSNNRKPLQLLRNLGLLGLQVVPNVQQDFFNQMMGRGMARAELNLLQRYLLNRSQAVHGNEAQS